MANKPKKDQMEILEERKKKIEDRLKRLKDQKAAREKKREHRRHAIIGRMVMNNVQSGKHPHDRLIKSLDAYLSNNNERALFGLPPKNKNIDPDKLSHENNDFPEN